MGRGSLHAPQALDLSGAELRSANLTRARARGADWRRADYGLLPDWTVATLDECRVVARDLAATMLA